MKSILPQNNKTRGLLVLLVGAMVALGFVRDFIFVNLNYQLSFVYYEKERSFTHSFFDFLNNYSYSQLYYSKWWLTGIFALLNILLCLVLVYLLFKSKRKVKVAGLILSGLVVLAFIGYAAGYLTGSTDTAYRFARTIMGALQSPLPALFLIPGFLLERKMRE